MTVGKKVLRTMMLFTIFFTSVFVTAYGQTPVVMWHGMGDSCCSEGSLGKIQQMIEEVIPNIYIISLKFGNNTLQDVESGYFLDVNEQVRQACETIAADPTLQSGYNGIGFSQGGQFMRAVAQRCPNPPMRNLISIGGQHQGVYGLPHCGEPEPPFCNFIRKMLNHAAYSNWVQSNLVQAQYWHNPLDEEAYREHSQFIAEINNEKESVNPSYSENLQKLEKLVLVLFTNDSMVIPRESSWFGFYAPGQGETILSYQNTNVYQKDLIGLKQMDEAGKIDLLSVEGDHLRFTSDWFINNIVNVYLKQ